MTSASAKEHFQSTGLYDPANEHDACGVGFVAHIKGVKAHSIIEQGLKILENLDHRGAGEGRGRGRHGYGLLGQQPASSDPELAAEAPELAAEGPEPAMTQKSSRTGQIRRHPIRGKGISKTTQMSNPLTLLRLSCLPRHF